MSDATRKGDDDFAPKIVYRRNPAVPTAPAAGGPPLPGSPRSSVAAPPGTVPPPPARQFARAPESALPEEPGYGEEPARPAGRGPVWVCAAIQAGIAVGLVVWLVALVSARGWEVEKSFDVDEELKAALTGLDLMIRAAAIGAAGFLLSAIGMISARRLGWRIAVAWAALMTATGIGAVYGLPALVWLLARSTRSRFESI